MPSRFVTVICRSSPEALAPGTLYKQWKYQVFHSLHPSHSRVILNLGQLPLPREMNWRDKSLCQTLQDSQFSSIFFAPVSRHLSWCFSRHMEDTISKGIPAGSKSEVAPAFLKYIVLSCPCLRSSQTGTPCSWAPGRKGGRKVEEGRVERKRGRQSGLGNPYARQDK